jgi:hypothetical protein
VSKNENENRHYIEKDILIWEMENSKEEDRLFICRIRKTLQKYNLPSPEEIIANPPKKQQWPI